jgi:hypothetical protein
MSFDRVTARARLLVATGAAVATIATTTAVVAGVVGGANPGPFAACLSARQANLYNVASGANPAAACKSGDTLVAFSNAQGPQGEPGADGEDGADGKDGADGEDGAQGIQGPAGPASLNTLRGTPCFADGSSGRVEVTEGSGAERVAVDLACRKTPTFTVDGPRFTIPAGFTATLRDTVSSTDFVCQAGDQCSREYDYGHIAVVEVAGNVRFGMSCPGAMYQSLVAEGPEGVFTGFCDFGQVFQNGGVSIEL